MGPRGERAPLRAPECWAPLLGLLVAGAAFAALGRDVKVAGLTAVAAVVIGIDLAGLARLPTATGRARLLRWMPAIAPLAFALVLDLAPPLIERVFSDPSRRSWLSLLLVAFGTGAGLLVLIGVDVQAAIHRAVHAATAAVRTAIAYVLYVVVLLPLGIARRWHRDDPMRTGGRDATSAWHPVPPTAPGLATRTYRSEREQAVAERRSAPVRIGGFAVRAIGVVGLLLLADFAVGSAWEAVSPREEPTSARIGAGTIRIGQAADRLEPVDLAAPDAKVYPDDPREDLPAMAKYPWRHEYFQELQRATSTYWPYLLWIPLPARGEYINIDALGERRSYQSSDAEGPGVPDVDFYGGSTTYGEGQRDEHTIPSEVARLAAADGLPIRVHNRGVRGWVNWQEMLLFEQISADPSTRPDLAVFYDGANEFDAQSHSIQGVPAHTVLDEIAGKMAGDNALLAASSPGVPEISTWGHVQLLARDYREHSALARIGGWLHDTATGSPAGADPAEVSAPAQEPAPTEINVTSPDVQPIYQRGQALIEDIAERTDVDVTFFWQPLQDAGWPEYAEGLEPPTIDLSRVFVGHDDIFIDGTHHNEDGSLIAAEAIWEHLEPKVQAWYDGR